MRGTGSMTSYFKVSGSLIKEDLRKYWGLMLMAFVVYFLDGPFKIIMKYAEIDTKDDEAQYLTEQLADSVNGLLSGIYPAYSLIFLAVPITAAVMVFGYLHKPGHVVSVHAQPFTRCTLINSHTLSALIMSAVPILLNGMTLMLIMRPLFIGGYGYSYGITEDDGTEAQNYDVFTADRILWWIVMGIVTTLFVLAVCVFSAMIAGTQIHQIIASIGFNFVLNVIGMLIHLYFTLYLFGFTYSSMADIALLGASPLTAVYEPARNTVSFSENGISVESGLNLFDVVLYAVIALAIYAFSVFLYGRRKLERAGDGVVFKAVGIIITIIFGFIGMSVLGFLFCANTDESELFTAAGYIIGALLGILICRMILEKSLKVLNKGTIKLIGIFAACAVMFIGCIRLDAAGFEKYVPEDSDSIYFYGIRNDMMNSDGEYSTEASMEHIRNIHRYIIENKDLCLHYTSTNPYNYRYSGSYFENYGSVYFRYIYYDKDNNGSDGRGIAKTVNRSYDVPTYLMLKCPDYIALVNSSDNTNTMTPGNGADIPESSEVAYIRAEDELNGGSNTIYDKEQIGMIINALKEDLSSLTFEDRVRTMGKTYVQLNLAVEIKQGINAYSAYSSDIIDSGLDTEWYMIYAGDGFKNTIDCLSEFGAVDRTGLIADKFPFAVVTAFDRGEGRESAASAGYVSGWSDTADIPRGEAGKSVVVTDPEKLYDYYARSAVLEAYGANADISTADDDVYMITFYYTVNDTAAMKYRNDVYTSLFIKGSDLSSEDRP